MYDLAQYIVADIGVFLYVATVVGMVFGIEKDDDAYLIDQDIWDNIRFNDPFWGTYYLECCDDYKYDPDFNLYADKD